METKILEPVTRKARFAWASIAGADAEPVELITEKGREGIYTLGFADPFWLDDESAGIVVYGGSPLVRPDNPETQEQREMRETKYRIVSAAKKAAYEWHRDNAKHGPDCALAACTGKDNEHRHGWRGAR